MSLIPLSLQHDLDELMRLPTHSFGLGLNPLDFYRPFSGLVPRSASGGCQTCGTVAKTGDGDFKVNINVKDFAPEELKITTEGNMILVEGKHEEKVDGDGLVWRHFVRKYLVPEGHHIEGAVSSLSKNGILTITAPKKGELKSGPTAIPIAHGQNDIRKAASK